MEEEADAKNVNRCGGSQGSGVRGIAPEVTGECGEVIYSLNPEDEENPVSGMIYQSMVDMTKDEEFTGGVIGEEGYQ